MLHTILALLTATPGLHPLPAPVAVVAKMMSDAEILGFLNQVDQSEIDEATFVVATTSSAGVRNYAQMLLTDHQKSMNDGKALATRISVTPTMEPDSAAAQNQRDWMGKLKTKTGAEFDKEFLDHAAREHRAIIDKINNRLIADAKSSDLKAHLRAMIPTLEKHERDAMSLRKTISD
jgi:putative membrane protein